MQNNKTAPQFATFIRAEGYQQGLYVETVIRNDESAYRVTDGLDKFWEVPAALAVQIPLSGSLEKIMLDHVRARFLAAVDKFKSMPLSRPEEHIEPRMIAAAIEVFKEGLDFAKLRTITSFSTNQHGHSNKTTEQISLAGIEDAVAKTRLAAALLVAGGRRTGYEEACTNIEKLLNISSNSGKNNGCGL